MQFIQVVGANGHQGSLSSKILVELVLESDEGLIPSLVKTDIPKYCPGNIWSNLLGLFSMVSPLNPIGVSQTSKNAHLWLHNECL